jgi:hypothetical protein
MAGVLSVAWLVEQEPVVAGMASVVAEIPAARRGMVTAGEHRLLMAVIERAWGDAVGYSQWPVFQREVARARADALAWLFQDDPADRPHTFAECCEAVGVDAEALRRRMRAALDARGVAIG